MLEFRTQGFKGFNVKYSPFFDNRIAVATGQHFGIVGNGRLFILGLNEKGIMPERWFDTQDVLHDIAWSEVHENQILTASGDGTVKLFDIGVPDFPIQSWTAHGREVFAVHWNLVAKNTFLSASWDGSVKIFDPSQEQAISALPTHSCTYSAQFSPHDNGVVSAVSSDSNLRVWDLRTRASAQNHLVMTVPLHAPPRSIPGRAPIQGFAPSEALTHDWNKYRGGIIAAAGVDRIVRVFDLRNASGGPVAVLPGHQYAVRRLSWSPHVSDILMSASYDMTCRLWKDGSAMGVDSGPPTARDPMAYGGGGEVGRMDRHTEFTMGLDWCLFGAQGWCASTAWDERVLIWDAKQFMRP